MMTDREAFIQKAIQVEQQSYWEKGRGIDGSPYEAGDSDFLDEAFLFFGEQNIAPDGDKGDAYTVGEQFVVNKVMERRSNGEGNAQVNCGNWWLWTILNELNVSRVKR